MWIRYQINHALSFMFGKGGDRKSLKFCQKQQRVNKRLLITDFLAAKHSKQRHLKLPQFISAKKNLEREKQCLNDLITQLEEKEVLRGNTTVARWRLEEIRSGFFLNPRTSNEIKVACEWTTSKKEIDAMGKSIKDHKEKCNAIEAACEIEVETAKKE